MKCKECGNVLNENAVFCDKCGCKVESEVENKQKNSNKNKGEVSIDLTKANFFAVISTVIVIISVFCPYISITVFGSTLQKALIDGDGVIILILSAIIFLFAILNINIGVLIGGVILFILFFIENSTLTKLAQRNEISSAIVSSLINKGAGYYLFLIASVLIIASGIFGIYKKNNKLNIKFDVKNIKEKFINKIEKYEKIKIGKKMLQIIIGIVIIVFFLICGMIFLVNIGKPGKFIRNENKEILYKFKDGHIAKNEWVVHGKNKYYFDKNGIKQTNKWVDNDYYVDEDGRMKRNYFLEENDDTYYLKDNGKYARDELVDVNGKTYAFTHDGKNSKNAMWPNASPSYVAYVNSDGYIEKTKGYMDADGETIYIKDNETGALITDDWLENEDTKEWNYFDSNGWMQKNKLITGMSYGDDSIYTSEDLSDLSVDYMYKLYEFGEILNITYHYVDENGAMVKNASKTINNIKWTFDEDGKGEKELWVPSKYTDTHRDYIKNEVEFIGQYDNSLNEGNPAYLTIYTDNEDVTFFLYEGKSKNWVKNNMTYNNKDYTGVIISNSLSNGYKFTATMYTKGNRVFVDNNSAINTIKNLLQTGESFLLAISENDGWWPNTYMFFIDAANYPKIYKELYHVKSGWEGDYYYENGKKVINEWKLYNNDWYYLDSDGEIAKSKWVDNNQYYVDEKGKMLKNTTTPDGYIVDANGKYVEEAIVKTETATGSEITKKEKVITEVKTTEKEMPLNFTDGYEKAVFEKYNSTAKTNGLGGTKIYVTGVLGDVFVSGDFYDASIDVGNNQKWLLRIEHKNLQKKSVIDLFTGHKICVVGIYDGWSKVYEQPHMIVNELFDYTTESKYKSTGNANYVYKNN